MTLREHLDGQARVFLLALYDKHAGDWRAVCREASVSNATLYRKLPRRSVRKHALSLAKASAPPPKRFNALVRFFGVWTWRGWRDQPLDAIYAETREGYLRMVKALHPDATGGNEARTARLVLVNDAWARLERAFRARGHRG